MKSQTPLNLRRLFPFLLLLTMCGSLGMVSNESLFIQKVTQNSALNGKLVVIDPGHGRTRELECNELSNPTENCPKRQKDAVHEVSNLEWSNYEFTNRYKYTPIPIINKIGIQDIRKLKDSNGKYLEFYCSNIITNGPLNELLEDCFTLDLARIIRENAFSDATYIYTRELDPIVVISDPEGLEFYPPFFNRFNSWDESLPGGGDYAVQHAWYEMNAHEYLRDYLTTPNGKALGIPEYDVKNLLFNQYPEATNPDHYPYIPQAFVSTSDFQNDDILDQNNGYDGSVGDDDMARRIFTNKVKNNQPADALISIHSDSREGDDPRINESWPGALLIYPNKANGYSGQSKCLADYLIEKMDDEIRPLLTQMNASRQWIYKQYESGSVTPEMPKPKSYYIDNVQAPAVIIELGNVKNLFDLSFMVRTDFQEAAMRGVQEGLNEFFENNMTCPEEMVNNPTPTPVSLNNYYLSPRMDFTIFNSSMAPAQVKKVISLQQPAGSEFVGYFWECGWRKTFIASASEEIPQISQSLINRGTSYPNYTINPKWWCTVGGPYPSACTSASTLLGGKEFLQGSFPPSYINNGGWPGSIVYSAFGHENESSCHCDQSDNLSVYHIWKGPVPETWPLTVEVNYLDVQQLAPGVNSCILIGSTVINCIPTSALGQAAFSVPPGNYRFAFEKNGHLFFSGDENHITVPDTGFYSIAIPPFPDPIPVLNGVTVTVTGTNDDPETGITVQAFDGSTDTGYSETTDSNGDATLYLPDGSYHFRVEKDGVEYWSGADDHCAVSVCSSASIRTAFAVTVTVLDAGNQPQAEIPVWVYDDTTYTGVGGTTDSEGQATLYLGTGSYRFRIDMPMRQFWSGETNHCTVPTCSTVDYTAPYSVVVTVADANNNPKPEISVWAYDGNSITNSYNTTNAQGQTWLYLPAGNYRFKTIADGITYWSGPANHCEVPGCTAAGIAAGSPVVLTVTDIGGQAQAGVRVWAMDGTVYAGFDGWTDDQGQLTLYLPAGNYRFRIDRTGIQDFSAPANHCAVPECASVAVTVNQAVAVTVTDANGNPNPSLNVYAYNGTITTEIFNGTNAQGVAMLYLPLGSYRFRVTDNGSNYWSGTANHCTVPECRAASIGTGIPVVITVRDITGAVQSGAIVRAFDGNVAIGIVGTTDAQGMATLRLPAGSFRFRIERPGNSVYSAAENHCTVPACTSVDLVVSMPVTVSVRDANGAPKVGLYVYPHNSAGSVDSSGKTNAQGDATVYLPAGTYRFRVTENGSTYWSAAAPHCTVPECTSASVATGVPVVVTVTDPGGTAQVGAAVRAYTDAIYVLYIGTTDSQGKATLYLPAGSYRFRIDRTGNVSYSASANHCTVPACTGVNVTVPKAVTVSVRDANGNPKPGLNVLAYNSSAYVGIAGAANAQGIATLFLPAGTYRFRVTENGSDYWSAAAPNCTVPGCAAADITTNIPTTVTVTNLDGVPEGSVYVHAFNGSTFIKTAATNAQGQASFTLADGSYRFRVDKLGREFWSGPANHCEVPSCTSVNVAIQNVITVTVKDTQGNPDVGLDTWAYNGSVYYGAVTNAQGQALIMVPAGSYRFKTAKNWAAFWSGDTYHCTVIGCSTASITTNIPTTVTVTNLDGVPEGSVYVHAFDGSTFIRTAQTNAQGQASFTLADGNYRFRVDKLGREFWSGPANHCEVPSCTSIAVAIQNVITVTVKDTQGNPDVGLDTWAYNGSVYYGAVTNAQGVALIMVPTGSYRFKTAKNGAAFWSGDTYHCTVIGCSTASITTNIPTTVTVTNLEGVSEGSVYVHAFDGSTFIRTAQTNAQGQANFTLADGSYRFRVDKPGREFWSGPANHCEVPGCTSVNVTIPNTIVLTVQDANGNPEAGLTVASHDGTTQANYATTDAQGKALVMVPFGSYRFLAIKDGVAYWSGETTHCTVPGCSTATITIP